MTTESHPIDHPDTASVDDDTISTTTTTTNYNNNKHRIPPEATKILQQLASTWSEVMDATAMQVVQLKGAMTNEVYEITWETEENLPTRKVLLRIYGEGVDVLFDRTDEILAFKTMSRHGQGPSLLGIFPNGRIEEFINARVCCFECLLPSFLPSILYFILFYFPQSLLSVLFISVLKLVKPVQPPE